MLPDSVLTCLRVGHDIASGTQARIVFGAMGHSGRGVSAALLSGTMPSGKALPSKLGDWHQTLTSALGAYGGHDLSRPRVFIGILGIISTSQAAESTVRKTAASGGSSAYLKVPSLGLSHIAATLMPLLFGILGGAVQTGELECRTFTEMPATIRVIHFPQKCWLMGAKFLSWLLSD